jgi:hypothetical protein
MRRCLTPSLGSWQEQGRTGRVSQPFFREGITLSRRNPGVCILVRSFCKARLEARVLCQEEERGDRANGRTRESLGSRVRPECDPRPDYER